MEAIRELSYREIQDGLLYGVSSVTKNILNPLGIDRSKITLKDLITIISNDLHKLKFDFDSVPLYDNAKEHSVPGFIDLRTYDVKDGGIVKINCEYSTILFNILGVNPKIA